MFGVLHARSTSESFVALVRVDLTTTRVVRLHVEATFHTLYRHVLVMK